MDDKTLGGILSISVISLLFGGVVIPTVKRNYDNDLGLRAEVRGIIDSNRDGMLSVDEKQQFYQELGLPYNDDFDFSFEQGKEFLTKRGIATPYRLIYTTL